MLHRIGYERIFFLYIEGYLMPYECHMMMKQMKKKGEKKKEKKEKQVTENNNTIVGL